MQGRVHHALGNYTQAVQYLQQGLQIAEQLGRREDEAKIRYRLGLSLWGRGQLDECQQQLYQAADLFETIRRESQNSSDYKLSLFDLQTACYQALQVSLIQRFPTPPSPKADFHLEDVSVFLFLLTCIQE